MSRLSGAVRRNQFRGAPRGRSALPVSNPAPTWSSAPVFSVTAGQSISVLVPVTVSNGAVIALSWVGPGSKPAWATLNSGTAPTISFSGTQVDADDVSNIVLNATANSITVSSPSGSISVVPPVGLSYAYVSNEGYSTVDGTEGGFSQRLVRGQVAYESAFATKDGTLIEAFDGAHGRVPGGPGVVRGTSNRVGEWSPATRAMAEVFPENWEDHGSFGYDNLIYCYFDSIDSLVSFRHGVFSRAVTDTMVNRLWNGGVPSDSSSAVWTPSSASNSGTSAWTHRQDAGTDARFPRGSSDVPPPAGRPPVWSTNVTQSPAPLIYIPSSRSSQFDQHVQYYNVHCAYSKQFDFAIIIGGGPNVQDPGQSAGSVNIYVTALVPSNLIGTYSARYYANNRSYSRSEVQIASEVGWATGSGRAGIKFLGHYVYWGGGFWNSAKVPYFWRADVRPILANPTADLGTTFVPERLADIPGGGCGQGMMAADPYSNSIVCVGKQGVSVYDVASNTWTDVTSQCTDYAAYWSPGNYPWYMCGDFIDAVTSSGAKPQKTYWYGGHDFSYPLGPGYSDRFNKVRSLKVSRGNTVSFINVEARNPENPSATFGPAGGIGPLRAIKHAMLSASNQYLYLTGGDWDDYYPSGNPIATSGYKSEGGGSPTPSSNNTQNGRQEIWRTDIADAVATGTAKFYMVGNAYSKYPWTGSQGYYNSATEGPLQPDGHGSFVDSAGNLWVGPHNTVYDELRSMEIGGQELSYAAMFKWSPPGYNNTGTTGAGINGVALGNGWTVPNQDRLAQCFPSGSAPVGTAGVDYDFGFTSGSCVGWCRPNKGPAYDATDNKARAISVYGFNNAGTFSIRVSLFTFNCTPDGLGKHTWTKQDSAAIPVQTLGGPPQNIVTAIDTTWGTGGIGNTCQIGRRLYATFLCDYGVTAGNGNVSSTNLNRAVILSINVDNLSDITWIPFPQQQNWWLRPWDGPQAAEGASLSLALTPGQYRSMVALGTKLIIGPEAWNKIGTDPWICVYDTSTKAWTPFNPPADHDWPNTIMGLVPIPSLGEVWLCGQPTTGWSSNELNFVRSNNMHNTKDLYDLNGIYASRRIARFKVS